MRRTVFAAAALLGAAVCAAPALAQQEVRASSMPLLLIERSQDTAFRSDEIELELPPQGQDGSQMEYKLAMTAGQFALYSLTASHPVTAEFHGHAVTGEGVIFYREQAEATESHGQFIAPMDGIHGWYLSNPHDHPVSVTIRAAGYYELTDPIRF